MSAELLNFHEVVNHMQEAEEEVIDNHRALLEVIHNFRCACVILAIWKELIDELAGR